jgi:hypothetical protein
MALKIPKSARFSLTINNGTNQATGAMIKKSISFGNLNANCDADAVSAVANAIGGLISKPVADVTVTENYQLI